MGGEGGQKKEGVRRLDGLVERTFWKCIVSSFCFCTDCGHRIRRPVGTGGAAQAEGAPLTDASLGKMRHGKEEWLLPLTSQTPLT